MGDTSAFEFSRRIDRKSVSALRHADLPAPRLAVVGFKQRVFPTQRPDNSKGRGRLRLRRILLVDPGLQEYSSFRATITRDAAGAEQVVQQLNDLHPSYQSLLAVGVSGRLLSPGEYEVQIEGLMDDWESGRALDAVNRVPFRVE